MSSSYSIGSYRIPKKLWWWFPLSIVLALLGAFLLHQYVENKQEKTKDLPDLYEVHATLLIKLPGQAASDASGTSKENLEAQIKSLSQYLSSEELAGRVLTDLESTSEGFSEDRKGKQAKDYVKNLEIERVGRESTILHLYFRDEKAEVAARYLNQLLSISLARDLEKRAEAGITIASSLPDFEIIERASAENAPRIKPNKPETPHIALIYLLALLAGIAIPFFISILMLKKKNTAT